MADDARISTALPSHPKTRKLKKRLGADGCWSLVCLLLFAAESKPDGNLEGMTDEDIELAADWGGKDGEFVSVLLEIRFLDGVSGAFTIHDWAEHNPYACTRGIRQAAARKAANAKWDAVRSALSCEADARRMQNAEKGNAHYTTPHLTSPPKPEREKFTLPEWVDPLDWQAWEDHRKGIKKPLKGRARQLAIGELDKLHAKGYSAKDCINHAILKGWLSFYEPKGYSPDQTFTPTNALDKLREQIGKGVAN
jgi:hypothetical protein